MENPFFITLALAFGGYLLFVMTYRGILLRRVMGITGRKTPEDVSYYVILIGFSLACVFLLLLAGVRFHRDHGWGGVVGYALIFSVLFWFTLRFRSIMRGAVEKMSSPISWRRSRRSKKSSNKHARDPDEPTPRMWTMAAVSLLSKVEGKDYFLLGGAELIPKKIKNAQKRLRKHWDITNEDRFAEECDWLFDYGHRKEFHDMIHKVSAYSEDEAQVYLQEIEEGKYGMNSKELQEDEKHRVEMARTNRHNVRYISFVAWDYLRYISLTREGYLAEYIEEPEAWNQIFSAAQILQSRYDSWVEMSKAFIVAREFWSFSETKRDGIVYERSLRQLQEDEKSPWNKILWELPLYNRR
ncbi:MAG: DUF1266 domain-containing protein [Bacteroidota bacterium]